MLTEAMCLVQSTLAQSATASPAEGSPVSGWSVDSGILVPVIAIIMGCSIAIIAIVCGTLASGQREKTRREIAAYVAEGTISPEDGERMLRAASMTPKKG
ncbi:MAG: hypothetical protein NXI14_07900 [bacterium]|nr:hypothetical protein [bacterium]